MSGRPASPVACLHGWGGSFASTWRTSGVQDALSAAGHDVLEVNLPGHGPGPHSHDPADYADLTSSVATALGQLVPAGEPIHGLGFSLGAKVLLELACRNPERFDRLVLAGLGANVFAPEPFGEVLADALERGLREDASPAVRRLVNYATAAGNDVLALAACLRRPANPVITADKVAKVKCPVLLIAGDADEIAQPLEPLAGALTAVEVVALSGLTHLELPEDRRFRDRAVSFLCMRTSVSAEAS